MTRLRANPDFEEILKQYNKNYNYFYNSDDILEMREYAIIFDRYLTNDAVFNDMVIQFGTYIGDAITSDTEAAAFAKTMEDLGYFKY